MNKPVLLAAVAAVAAALPIGALAQQGAPEPTRPQPACAEAPRADSALPARASNKPEPQLGTVASDTRVPSHTDTPSLRAMQSARNRQAGRGPQAAPGAGAGCAPQAGEPAPRPAEKQR